MFSSLLHQSVSRQSHQLARLLTQINKFSMATPANNIHGLDCHCYSHSHGSPTGPMGSQYVPIPMHISITSIELPLLIVKFFKN